MFFDISISFIFNCVLLYLQGYIVTAQVPCRGSEIGEQCKTDTDCIGEGTVCNEHQCQCHPNYLEFQATKTRAAFCLRAPDLVGSVCAKPVSYCKPPLICEGNANCVCVRGKTKNGTCFVRPHFDDFCEDNFDCTAPFQFCNRELRQCKCISGATFDQNRKKCVAEFHCPDGTQTSGRRCKVQSIGVSSVADGGELFENSAASGGVFDDCDGGEYCVTDGVSPFGFCCGHVTQNVTPNLKSNLKQNVTSLCPLGYEADSRFTCGASTTTTGTVTGTNTFGTSAASGTSATSVMFDTVDTAVTIATCPTDTHYCNRLVGVSFSVSLCCRKPCLEPTPIYVAGHCYDRSFLSGPCMVHEQCDGGLTMRCQAGTCQCRDGFAPLAGGPNDRMTCTRDCGAPSVAAEHKCLPNGLPLDAQCHVDAQCADASAHCSLGACRCKCGFVATQGFCVDAKTLTTTPAPAVATAVGAAPKTGTGSCTPGDFICFFRNLGFG